MSGLIQELKRRNVFRVGTAYVVLAWLLAQVSDLAADTFGAPDWVMKMLITLLALAFPLVLFFAWAYELTPEGIKKEKDVDRSQSITPQTGRKLDFIIIGVLVAALGYFVYDKFVLSSAREIAATEAGEAAAEEEREKSIAVLPFVNMSSDPEQEFFSDGISEEILNSLARVKELKVAGRTSSFAFKGQNQDLRKIGDALDVENILEGSVRKSGTKVRITAQLIQVEDGFHLWSETYDRELTDVFAIQDEIATAILEQLKAALIGLEAEPVVIAATRTDSEVYDQYLLAKQRLYERKRLSIESAVELLDKAIAKDPEYAPAQAQRGIAALLLSTRNYGEMSNADADRLGKPFLDKALELDPQLAEGWAGLGLYHGNRPGEIPQAIEALEKALSINPSLIDASNWLQIAYGALGDNRRALEILEQMLGRDPLYPPGFNNAINGYNLFGEQDKSWALIERVRPFLPGDPLLLQAEASTWMSLGNFGKALPLLDTALESQPTDGVMRNFRGWSLINTAQYERAIEDGQPWHQVLALTKLHRWEEALIIAQKLAGEGIVGPLIAHYDRTGQQRQLIDFIESRWPDLDAYESEYPDDGTGHGMMLRIARAYFSLGNDERFKEAMALARAAHDRDMEQGVKDSMFFAEDANYYILSGDRDRALVLLGQAVESGLSIPERFDSFWPAMQVLAGDPRFETLQARVLERVNAGRAELGLEPLAAST